MQRDLCDAGVFDVELVRHRQLQLEQDGEHHADDAAVAEHRHVFAGMIRDDFPQTRLDALAKNLSAFATGHTEFINLVQPFVRLKAELFLHFLPAKAAPFAEINLAGPGKSSACECYA